MSRVVVCGAGGAQGQEVLSLLRNARGDATLIALDKAALDLSRLGAVSVQLDFLAEAERLRAEVVGADLVINVAGPFHRLGPVVIDAAISAGANYLDICDDIDATEILWARDAAARRSGTVAVIGLGAAPGTTNLLVKLALEYLGAKQGESSAEIAWCAPGSELTFGIFEHLVHCFRTALPDCSAIPDWESLQPRAVDFAAPIGPIEVVRLGHPEPLTLRRSFGCRTTLLGGLTAPGLLFRCWELARECDTGRDLGDAWSELQKALPRSDCREPSGMVIDVGLNDGRGVRFESATSISMEQSTAVPAVAGALMLLDGVGPTPGVWPPESIDPKRFFEVAGRVSPGGGGLRAFTLSAGEVKKNVSIRDLFRG